MRAMIGKLGASLAIAAAVGSAAGCKKKEVVDVVDVVETPPVETPPVAGASGVLTDANGNLVAPVPTGPGRFQPETVTSRLASGGYVCDAQKATSVCYEIAPGDSVLSRKGVEATALWCGEKSGSWALGADGAVCPAGFIASCTAVSGDRVTHYYSTGSAPWTISKAQAHCGTAGDWTPNH